MHGCAQEPGAFTLLVSILALRVHLTEKF